MQVRSYERAVDVIRRANQIAASASLDDLLNRTLDLFIEVAGAEAGTLYLYEPSTDELIFKVVKGDPASQQLIGARFPAHHSIAGAALRANEPMFVGDVEHDPRLNRPMADLGGLQLRTAYCLPLALPNQPVGVVQVFNLPAESIDDEEELALLQLLGQCMVNGIEKTRLLNEAQRREQRLGALVDIISRLTTTLDRDELLKRIMDHARDLLDVEATSVWELDEQRNLLVLHVATGDSGEKLKEVTLPVGEGYIGEAVARGRLVLAQDVQHDPRHYKKVDQQTGFITRSVLTIPLRSPSIQLGTERGELHEAIIGGAQAINKRTGHFTNDDIALFEALAAQAATVLRLSRLYTDTEKLLIGMIKALANAVDARDRHNRQHSQRVSDFSVAIAEEMRLSREDVYHVRMGSLLHDIGKIGIPDEILDKPGRLTDDELAEMRSHTTKGHEILSQQELRWLLRTELPALLQHHERLDGKGYPQQLTEKDISWIAKIIAVADVFDALSSDRPYKPGWDVEKVLEYLRERKGTEFDSACVDALCRARQNGKIVTQRERIQ
jgi:putative nucleotidyltransferase with HDIG domain